MVVPGYQYFNVDLIDEHFDMWILQRIDTQVRQLVDQWACYKGVQLLGQSDELIFFIFAVPVADTSPVRDEPMRPRNSCRVLKARIRPPALDSK